MDKRGKRIVYLSQCLLNQNLRFPGIAVESGAITELLTIIIKKGLGIEPLPCLERIGWGGVSRKTFYKFFPIISSSVGTIKFPIIKLILKRWILSYKKLCKKEAKKILLQMQDYLESGYSILGIITTNDSPTCGFNKTIDLLKSIKRYKELEMTVETLRKPNLEEMKYLIPSLCEEGSGFFMSELIKQIKKSNLDINIIGFEIWNNLAEETEKVLKKLNLTP